jgi:soluble lytic murein transglycosylase-like protein
LKPLAIALWLAVALSAVAIPRYTLDAVLAIGQGAGVPREITYALMMEESGGDAAARSKLTCEGYRSRGLFQLYERPSNLATLIARYWLGPFDILNPLQNATVALRYLADLYGRFGTWELALWFYNSGRIVNVPASTRAYARRIVGDSE